MQREDFGGFLLDLLANGLLNEFLGQLLQSTLLHLSNHNLHHLASDHLPLRPLSIASSLHLLAGPPGKPNSRQSQHKPIRGLALHKTLNHRVPFLHKLAQLIPSNVHTIEIGIAIKVLDFLNLYLNLPPSLTLTLSLQISQVYVKHSPPK